MRQVNNAACTPKLKNTLILLEKLKPKFIYKTNCKSKDVKWTSQINGLLRFEALKALHHPLSNDELFQKSSEFHDLRPIAFPPYN
jgi:hypothetical protein